MTWWMVILSIFASIGIVFSILIILTLLTDKTRKATISIVCQEENSKITHRITIQFMNKEALNTSWHSLPEFLYMGLGSGIELLWT